MPTPHYLPSISAKGLTAEYQFSQLGDLTMIYGWQYDADKSTRLIWLNLCRKDQNKQILLERMRSHLPNAAWREGQDRYNLAQSITHAWRSDQLDTVPMALYGTAFQHKVWQALLRLKADQNPTYGQIAASIGQPKASRAVGSAVGANPICLLVPCHRVLPQSGGVGNYGCGSDIKAWLLAQEKQGLLAAA